ncbi:Nn.00g061540.m01.CDS01 [Neocucurbitaria sp. VM-36]
MVSGYGTEPLWAYKSPFAKQRVYWSPPESKRTITEPFDPASILILNRLDQVLSRLGRSDTSTPLTSITGQLSTAGTAAPGPQFSESQVGVSPWQNQLKIPARLATADIILQWAIFEGRYQESHLTNAVFEAEILEDSSDVELSAIHQRLASKGRGSGIDEDAIPCLVQKFLDLVHTKNPVLDCETILAHARRAAEFGLGWDSPSCLVLLACALGSVAQPFRSDASEARPRSSLEADAEQLQQGEAYYNLARRRFGFLDKGIIVPQCYFLAGVYLMYTMRPLMAWSQFHQASASYHLYLQCQARRPYQAADDTRAIKRRGQEQRLYWSCYKSECELRSELDLPHSSLADLEYPDMYPSPPNSRAADEISEQQEQSWFYYLTEITLRRISNRVVNTLYASDYRCWNEEKLPSMIKAAEQFNEQLQEWYSSVPEPIRFSEDAFHTEELPYMVQLRFISLQLLVYQPFLHYAIHNPNHARQHPAVRPMAERALSTCLRTIHDDNLHHRHHGSWLYTRWVITAALTIIASAASRTVQTPPNWREVVCALIDRLRYWEAEGPGVARAVQLLEDMLSISPDSAH